MKKIINNDEIFPAIQKLFYGVIPELYSDFFKKYSYIPFEFLEDNTGIIFQWNVEKKVIQFSAKSLRVVWLFTLAIWNVYKEEAQNIINNTNDNSKNHVKDCYNQAIKLMMVPDEGNFNWPENMLHPDDVVCGNKNLNIEEDTCFKLACFALSFIFLHEYNHAISNHSSITGYYALNEELESDRFAFDILLDGVEKYSKQTGQNLYSLYLLRFLGIFFSLIFLYKHEQVYNNNRGSHPLVKKRMLNLITKMLYIKSNGEYIFKDNDECFAILFLILKSEVDFQHLNLNTNNTAKDIIIEMITHLK